MKKYQVFENNQPCSTYAIKGWEKDTFDTFEEAQKFAVEWCYPAQIDDFREWLHPTELGVPINMSYCEFPVMMCIKEVQA